MTKAKNFRRWLGCFLAAASVFCLVACGAEGTASSEHSSSENSESSASSSDSSGEPEKKEHLGLYLENGQMKYDGKNFYGLGVNYYSLFNYTFTHKWSTEVPCAALEKLAEYDVKVIRFSCEPPSTFGATKWDWYFQKKDRYFQTLDTLVNKAEEVGIGLIVEFFGDLYNIANYYDEPLASSVRDENSKSSKFRRDYVKEVVTRYKDSPAVYGWEFGNELAWNELLPKSVKKAPALPPNSSRPSRTEDDILGLEEVEILYSSFASTVKEYDPYNRIVGSGDQSLRSTAYNACHRDMFNTDTIEEHREILAAINPDGMDAVCMHRYADGVKIKEQPDKLNLLDGSKVELIGEDGKSFVLYDTWQEYFRYMLDESKRLGKTCYLGEAGWMYIDAKEHQTYEDALSAIEGIAQAAYEAKFPLILFWNYDPLTQQTQQDFVDRGSGIEYSWNEKWDKGRAYLETIKKYNGLFEKLSAGEKA